MPLGKSSRTTSQGRKAFGKSPTYRQDMYRKKVSLNKRQVEFKASTGFSYDWLFVFAFILSLLIGVVYG